MSLLLKIRRRGFGRWLMEKLFPLITVPDTEASLYIRIKYR